MVFVFGPAWLLSRLLTWRVSAKEIPLRIIGEIQLILEDYEVPSI